MKGQSGMLEVLCQWGCGVKGTEGWKRCPGGEGLGRNRVKEQGIAALLHSGVCMHRRCACEQDGGVS